MQNGVANELAAVVLAAGAGTRLRPLSLVRPKVLCPVANVPLVDGAIERAASVTSSIAVNVHHGRAALENHLAGRVHLSIEEPEPLGTAGALGRLRAWIDGRSTLVLNGDTWSPGSLSPYVDTWDGTRVRILVVDSDVITPTSAIAGALLPWCAVAPLEPVPAGLWEASWRRLAADDEIDIVRYDRPCVDCGTPAAYLAANLIASGGQPVVGPGAVVEGTLERSVVWPGGFVRAGEHLADAIRVGSRLTVLVR
jgi:NDP-sugar pyrophosphorylase family protein